MPRPTKVNYADIEREYVTTGTSFRELGRRYGINYSTLAQRARNENWKDKRLAYEQSLSRRTYERIADKVAAEQADIKKENVLALRMGVRKFAQDVATGNISISASDAVKMIEALAHLVSEPESPEADDTIAVKPVGRPDEDFLRRVVEAARGQISRAGVLEAGPPVGSEGTKLN